MGCTIRKVMGEGFSALFFSRRLLVLESFDNCILNDNFVLLFHVSRPVDAFEKRANCIEWNTKMRQRNFERYATAQN